MHMRVWEFQVKSAFSQPFRATYAPQGEWAALFRQAAGYLGTDLLQDTHRFTTIDLWQSEDDWKNFRAKFGEAYLALDQKCESWTEKESNIGSFNFPQPQDAPPFAALTFLHRRLSTAGVRVALGGSGLLRYLGFPGGIRDWDLTTEAPWSDVAPLVADLEYELIPPNGIYATQYLCKIRLLGASIDLMGEFALQTTAGSCAVPTRITGEWNGIPLGCPEAWSRAYELLQRPQKADFLKQLPERDL